MSENPSLVGQPPPISSKRTGTTPPLLIGQLKAIAAPFYTHLHAAAPIWLEAERTANGTHHPGSIFPWTSATSDDNNKGVANIGQLKAAFSLHFEHDADIDGMPGLWEEAAGLDQDNPGDADTDLDDDGLTNLGEYGKGTDPANPDTDYDGTTDGDETLQGSDPKNPADKPVAEWFVLTGDLGPEEEKSRSRTVTIPKGESRLLVVALHSEEYPGYTENFSEFDDLLTWDIRPQGKDPVTGEVHVNDRHTDWELAQVDGVEILGFSPAHIETTAKYSAPGDSDLVIEIDLSATNVSDGALPSTVMVGLLPVKVTDNLVATGVDDISKTANAADIGYQEDFWIMAPLQGPESSDYGNPTNVSIGMGSGNTGVLSSVNATPLPPNLNLNGDSHPIDWRGIGTGVDSEEPVKTSINDSGESFPLPVKVKTMKWRRVKVALHEIISVVPGQPNNPPNLKPDKEQLEQQLNRVFGDQINAWFDVTILPAEPVEFDIADSNTYAPRSFISGASPVPGDGHLAFNNWWQPEVSIATANRPVGYDIHIYVLGGASPIVTYQASQEDPLVLQPHETVVGYANIDPNANYCIIDGDRTSALLQPAETTAASVLDTIAHEVGHIMVGGGHPDEANSGKAPLIGTDRTCRLMCSGLNRAEDGILLVKQEWDDAEKWLKENPDRREQDQENEN